MTMVFCNNDDRWIEPIFFVIYTTTKIYLYLIKKWVMSRYHLHRGEGKAGEVIPHRRIEWEWILNIAFWEWKGERAFPYPWVLFTEEVGECIFLPYGLQIYMKVLKFIIRCWAFLHGERLAQPPLPPTPSSLFGWLVRIVADSFMWERSTADRFIGTVSMWEGWPVQPAPAEHVALGVGTR